MMKKWVSLFLGFVFIFAFSACDKENVGDDRETGPWIVWSSYYTDFEEFQTFFLDEMTTRHPIKIVMIDGSKNGSQDNEYIFEGGVINAITREELFMGYDSYEFSFSCIKNDYNEEVGWSRIRISGTSEVLSQEEIIDLTNLNFICIQEGTHYKEYTVSSGELLLCTVRFSISNLTDSICFDSAIDTIKQCLVIIE